MAIDRRTLDEIRGMRIDLDGTVGFHEQQLILAWARSWSELRGAWLDAIDDLVAASQDGAWPSRAKIRKARRAQAALALTTDALDQLARDFQVRILRDVPKVVGDAAQWEARLMAAQLPETEVLTATLAGQFDRIDARALDAIVERTTGRITSLTQPLSTQAETAMRSALVRGVALGQHPERVTTDLLQRLEGGFNGGRNRALVIARTELLDAHRAAAYGQDQANAKTLRGWQWVATLDRRTCPSCWGMHGTDHPLEEPGPLDHQQGRCARIPRIRPWSELGIDVDEPEDLLPVARDVFDRLPREDQLAIMGPERLRLLDDEQIDFGDLAKKRSTGGWRDSYAPASTRDLLRVVNQSGR
ncbi:phage minor head protein [Phycicoccus avicenniae]|uniref:phage minor head protein n=1 Tax=Phycicoccus avicenniae TaxID=2828860 RepID=UPI003D265C5B